MAIGPSYETPIQPVEPIYLGFNCTEKNQEFSFGSKSLEIVAKILRKYVIKLDMCR